MWCPEFYWFLRYQTSRKWLSHPGVSVKVPLDHHFPMLTTGLNSVRKRSALDTVSMPGNTR